MSKVTLNGQEFDFIAAVNLMDDDLREEIHALGIETDQDFLDLYAKLHAERFGERFVLN